MAFLIVGHTAAAAGDVWSFFQSSLVLSCYSPNELCDRYDRDFDPNGVGNRPGCISRAPDPRTGWYDGFPIFKGNDACRDREVNLAADAGGCWQNAIDCSVPATVDPNLGGSRCPDSGPSPLVGNPIHAATGNKYQLEVDRDTGDPGLRFDRHYNSLAPGAQRTTIGNKWRHSFSTRLSPLYADSDVSRVVLRQPDGREHYFFRTETGYRSRTSASQLTFTNDTWRLLDPTGRVDLFDTDGRLGSVRHPNGKSVTLTYDAHGLLTAITDQAGRHLILHYDTNARITRVTDASGAYWLYAYDDLGNLAAVTFPDITPDDTDNPTRLYHYEDARFPSHLTGITDERGSRAATWGYDGQGRAVASTYADGIREYNLTFNDEGTTSVTDPIGRTRRYRFTTVDGVIRVTSIADMDCNNCRGHETAYTYDANGFVASKTDFNGNVTTYERDDLGRELSRTEASGTPEARTTKTTWHSGIRKPLIITEPGRITTYTYDAQGRMLSSDVRSAP